MQERWVHRGQTLRPKMLKYNILSLLPWEAFTDRRDPIAASAASVSSVGCCVAFCLHLKKLIIKTRLLTVGLTVSTGNNFRMVS